MSMSRSPLRPRRTRAETDALRAEAIRLSALGLSQRKIAGVLEARFESTSLRDTIIKGIERKLDDY